MDGIGKYTFADGDYHEGYYLNDQKNGIGIFTFAKKKEVYEGEFKNDLKHGLGELYKVLEDDKRKLIEKGIWKNGSFKQTY